MLSSLTFAVPWALVTLFLLPFLWRLLRVMPPAPRRQSFPAIRFLLGVNSDRQTATHLPWWLLVLRLVLVTLVILGIAHPLLDAVPQTSNGPLMLVVDNGWAAARQWEERHRRLNSLIDQAARANRPVIVLATAPSATGDGITASGLLSAEEARGIVSLLKPYPWPVDRQQALKALATLPREHLASLGGMQIVWISDGLENGDNVTAFAKALQDLGKVELVLPSMTAALLMPPNPGANEFTVQVRHIGVDRSFVIRAWDTSGHILARQELPKEQTDLTLPMPTGLRNLVSRLDIEGEETAGAVVLIDGRWQRRPVGLLDNRRSVSMPLLDDLFYVERALSPFADVRHGTADDLLKSDLSLIVLPDRGNLPEGLRASLHHWIEAGGVLLRLAGPQLAAHPDDLLPVRLRDGGRMLGGAMSWTKPMAVAPMIGEKPFAGLNVPSDLRITAQVLAEPAIDLNDKTWARLEDGTPLVTAEPIGHGWLVLMHTTVWPSWSNLGLSGLFPEMLDRLLDLSRGVPGTTYERSLPPLALLDGFGHLSTPSGIVDSLPPAAVMPDPHHPPGYYGDQSGRRAFNLSSALPPLHALTVPAGVRTVDLSNVEHERDLQPFLLLAALILLLCDMAIIRMLSRRLGKLLIALLLLVGFLGNGQKAQAADDTLEAALTMRLAFVITGDASLDETSRAGLLELSHVVVQRTTAVLGDPEGVDLDHDSLAALPLLYWPITERQKPLSESARARLNDFMRLGGMVLIDTRGETSPEALRRLTEGLDIPPLISLPSDHVLTRSFYLLREEPGRLVGGDVFAEQGGDPANDNVSPVIIGGNDWAAAWAVDQRGIPLYAVIPGGEVQREMAFRFGINLVMYALTGDYKADQVHVPVLMERLKR